MAGAAETAATGLNAAYFMMEVNAHNLANQKTAAFGRTTVVNATLTYPHIISGTGGGIGQRALGVPTMQVGAGVRTAATLRDMKRGLPKPTGNSLDVYVNGPGYFRIDLGQGRFGYTRAGKLKLDEDGVLRTATDYALSDNITLNMAVYSSVLIDKSGRVFGVDNTQVGNARYQELGAITLWNFTNPQGLEPQEDTVLIEGSESGTVVQGTPGESGFGTIQQGYVEQSNVNPPAELIEAVSTQQMAKSLSSIISLAERTENDALDKIASAA